MAKSIFLIAGGSDLQVGGNQSIKNTIKGFLKSGWDVHLFTFLPKNDSSLLNERGAFGDLSYLIAIHRLPASLSFFFYLIRWIKNILKKISSQKEVKKQYLKPDKVLPYFADISSFGQLVYVFSWLCYIPLEVVRVLYFIIKNGVPNIFYGYEIYGAPVAWIVARLLGKPCLSRFQGTALSLQNSPQWIWRYPHHVLGLKTPTDAIIMTNDGTKGKEVLERLGVPSQKIYFWMNGLDEETTVDHIWDKQQINYRAPRTQGIPSSNFVFQGFIAAAKNRAIQSLKIKRRLGIEKKKVLLSASKLKIWKRIDRIIYACYKLKITYNLRSVILLIIGEGEEKERLLALVKKYKIQDLVMFLGNIPHKEICKFFAIADVFVITNDVSNLSNQLLEALSFGLPIVSLADGSTNGLLQHEYNALLVPLEKIKEGLAEAIYRILTDNTLAERLKDKAKETALQKIKTWEERMEKEITLINEIIKRAKIT